MNRTERLAEIDASIRSCTGCKLHLSRKQAVPGSGPVDSKIMLIGEAPGFHENEQGLPFVGAAGNFLDSMLESIQMKRSSVYITNIIKCRPPQNRDPEPEEILACSSFLEEQIALIQPKAIITLGRFSMMRYFPNARISAIHGQARMVDDRLIIPMYHPAAALHQPSLRSVVEQDFHQIPSLLEKSNQAGYTPSTRESDAPDEPEQLSMF
ncbi:MAG: uracil-DNA glycosylase [Anaerolineales bacterium]|nr:uracil-DNA glycosylase [Anaerolineales bacterium]